MDFHLLERTNEGSVPFKDHLFPAARAPFKHEAVFVEPLDEDFIGVVKHLGPLFGGYLFLEIHQAL